jgi:hypothetical protein
MTSELVECCKSDFYDITGSYREDSAGMNCQSFVGTTCGKPESREDSIRISDDFHECMESKVMEGNRSDTSLDSLACFHPRKFFPNEVGKTAGVEGRVGRMGWVAGGAAALTAIVISAICY